MDLNRLFFKYFVYYPVVIARGEWIYPHLKSLRESQYWSRERLEDYQLSKLNRLLTHAKANTKAYKDYPGQLKSLEELKHLPFIEKDDIRDRFTDFLSKQRPLLYRDKTSGGSTGAPVTVRKDNRAMAQELAATWRGYEWAGIGVGDRQARFWGVPHNHKDRMRARLIDSVTNRRRISAFNFSEAEMEKFAYELQRFKPNHFYGYVSMLREFAQFIQKSSISLENIKAIFTTSEVLSEYDRELIQNVFKTPVYNEYGCGEIGTIAHECENGFLHINSENLILEVVDNLGNTISGEKKGEFIITELNNNSMPLIRYKMQDYGSVSTETCDCGRSLPLIEGIGGRAYDVLENTEGKKFHGEFFLYIMEDLKKIGCSVKGYQVTQESKERISIKIVPSNGYALSKAHSFIKKRFYDDFDINVEVCIKEVSQIEREKSGKLRVVKSYK